MSDDYWSKYGEAWDQDIFTTRPAESRVVMRDVMKMFVSDMAVAEVLLAFRSDPTDFCVWSDLQTIADRAGLPKSTAALSIKRLLARKLLVEELTPRPGRARRYDLQNLVTQLALARAVWEGQHRPLLKQRDRDVIPLERARGRV